MSEYVQKLRMRLGEKLPSDLNTDFQLQRWIDAHEQVYHPIIYLPAKIQILPNSIGKKFHFYRTWKHVYPR